MGRDPDRPLMHTALVGYDKTMIREGREGVRERGVGKRQMKRGDEREGDVPVHCCSTCMICLMGLTRHQGQGLPLQT